jgi:hypothetical protein
MWQLERDKPVLASHGLLEILDRDLRSTRGPAPASSEAFPKATSKSKAAPTNQEPELDMRQDAAKIL